MEHWTAATLTNLLAVAVFLAVAAVLRNRIGPLRRLGVPDSILAGALGLALGPSALDVVPLAIADLEVLVYHGFALVFVAVGLQRVRSGTRPGGARSIAVAIPTLALTQVAIGLAFVLAWSAGGLLHPGFALLPMLGFSQGPGQALSLGHAWESLGFVDGGQLGLTFAALGFASCCAVGVPAIAWARRRGWVTPLPPDDGDASAASTLDAPAAVMEPLTLAVVAIGVVYALVFGVLRLIVSLLPEGSTLVPTAWGFHFVIGALLAIGARRLLTRLERRSASLRVPLEDGLLGRIASVTVDVTTTAALCAVQLHVFGRWWLPVIVLTLLVTAASLLISLWLAKRAFPQAPFEHGIVIFGMSTGTLPTALALLRTLDPQLRSPVARNAALGVTGSIPFMAPLLVALVPFAVSLWTGSRWAALAIPLALCAGYALALLIAWRTVTPLKLLRPLASLWPTGAEREGSSEPGAD